MWKVYYRAITRESKNLYLVQDTSISKNRSIFYVTERDTTADAVFMFHKARVLCFVIWMRYMRASYLVERPVFSRVLSVLPYQVSRARENDIQLNAAKSCYSVRTIPPKGSNLIPVELKGDPIKVSTRKIEILQRTKGQQCALQIFFSIPGYVLFLIKFWFQF